MPTDYGLTKRTFIAKVNDSVRTLLLTEKEVKQLLSMQEAMEAVELAFAEKGLKRVQMPPKLYLFFKKYNGDLRTMPSYIEGLDVSAVKVVNVHPDNRMKYGLPTVMATIIVIDPKNGAPIAVIDGTWITDMRTGAAGGVAAKYLARKDSKIVGLVGSGAQSRTQLMALSTLYERLEEVRVWSRTRETREEFIQEMKPVCPNVDRMIPVEKIENAVRGADIVVTTTPSRIPIISNDWISPGIHINCIGADAPGKQELDPAILKRAKIVVDDWDQASHSGEINVPLARGIISQKDVFGELGEIVAGLKKGRVSADEITVFIATGLAIEDAVTAKIAFKKALAQRIGHFIEFI
jgi:alanine dehydrogenase